MNNVKNKKIQVTIGENLTNDGASSEVSTFDVRSFLT